MAVYVDGGVREDLWSTLDNKHYINAIKNKNLSEKFSLEVKLAANFDKQNNLYFQLERTKIGWKVE